MDCRAGVLARQAKVPARIPAAGAAAVAANRRTRVAGRRTIVTAAVIARRATTVPWDGRLGVGSTTHDYSEER